jgi:ABC-type branched-subunit amino acid transport system ATPase component
MPAVIEVQNMHNSYGDTVAVDEVSFTVQVGEIFGIPGPNGAGGPPWSTARTAQGGQGAEAVQLVTAWPADRAIARQNWS